MGFQWAEVDATEALILSDRGPIQFIGLNESVPYASTSHFTAM